MIKSKENLFNRIEFFMELGKQIFPTFHLKLTISTDYDFQGEIVYKEDRENRSMYEKIIKFSETESNTTYLYIEQLVPYIFKVEKTPATKEVPETIKPIVYRDIPNIKREKFILEKTLEGLLEKIPKV